jgi:excinuclease ABC subunit B
MKQIKYNEEHGITPKQIIKNLTFSALQREDRADIKELKRASGISEMTGGGLKAADPIVEHMTRPQLEKSIAETTRLMKEAAKNLDFLQAAQYRDEIIRLQKELEMK